ncbi:hypothetical protein JYT19_00380 [Sulfobacillus acidophilus]|uniref:Uncharacterized protein n=1 Tax=Sulfobacillus acidophilus TaxID=53633 RepID=A0ABS3AVG2_9FIRM|nr:hypothetical protein [Sulfobacillus acidophilus]
MRFGKSSCLPSEFLELSPFLYADDKYWIPENRDLLRFLFSADHKYFEKNKVWLSAVDKKARLCGFFNPDLLINNKKAAYFGFWETIDELKVNKKLFLDFENWAKAQRAQVIYGPINFNTFHSYRIRLGLKKHEGCFLGEPYNPSYYEEILQNLGYNCDEKYVSYSSNESFKELLRQMATNKEHMLYDFEKGELELKSFNKDTWLKNLEKIYHLVDSIFKDNFGYSKISVNNFCKELGLPLAKKLCPKTSLFAEDKNKNIVAIALNFPDYSPLLRNGNKNKLSLVNISFDEHFGLLKKPLMLGKTGGVCKNYRKGGLLSALAIEAMCRGVKSYSDVMICLMREKNPIVKFSRPFATNIRQYGLFAKSV